MPNILYYLVQNICLMWNETRRIHDVASHKFWLVIFSLFSYSTVCVDSALQGKSKFGKCNPT